MKNKTVKQDLHNPSRNEVLAIIIAAASVIFSFSPNSSVADEMKCEESVQVDRIFDIMWNSGLKNRQFLFLDCLKDYFPLGISRSFNTRNGIGYYSEIQNSYLWSALRFDPIGFFEYMDKNEEFFGQWVKEIDPVFYWTKKPPCGYEQYFSQLKLQLNKQEEKLQNYKSYQKLKPIIASFHCEFAD